MFIHLFYSVHIECLINYYYYYYYKNRVRLPFIKTIPKIKQPVLQQKMRPANSVTYRYGTLRYTLQAIHCCASYILLNRLGLGINSEFYAINTCARYILLSWLGLGINFIQWIPLRSYNDTQFVAVALFVVTPVHGNIRANYLFPGGGVLVWGVLCKKIIVQQIMENKYR